MGRNLPVLPACTRLPLGFEASLAANRQKENVSTEAGVKPSHVSTQLVSHPSDRLPSASAAGESQATAESKQIGESEGDGEVNTAN